MPSCKCLHSQQDNRTPSHVSLCLFQFIPTAKATAVVIFITLHWVVPVLERHVNGIIRCIHRGGLRRFTGVSKQNTEFTLVLLYIYLLLLIYFPTPVYINTFRVCVSLAPCGDSFMIHLSVVFFILLLTSIP